MQPDSLPILALAIVIHFVSFYIILLVSKNATYLVNKPVMNTRKKGVVPYNEDQQFYTSINTHETPRAPAGSSLVFNLKGFV
jgi:hypothetical protein